MMWLRKRLLCLLAVFLVALTLASNVAGETGLKSLKSSKHLKKSSTKKKHFKAIAVHRGKTVHGAGTEGIFEDIYDGGKSLITYYCSDQGQRDIDNGITQVRRKALWLTDKATEGWDYASGKIKSAVDAANNKLAEIGGNKFRIALKYKIPPLATLAQMDNDNTIRVALSLVFPQWGIEKLVPQSLGDVKALLPDLSKDQSFGSGFFGNAQLSTPLAFEVGWKLEFPTKSSDDKFYIIKVAGGNWTKGQKSVAAEINLLVAVDEDENSKLNWAAVKKITNAQELATTLKNWINGLTIEVAAQLKIGLNIKSSVLETIGLDKNNVYDGSISTGPIKLVNIAKAMTEALAKNDAQPKRGLGVKPTFVRVQQPSGDQDIPIPEDERLE